MMRLALPLIACLALLGCDGSNPPPDDGATPHAGAASLPQLLQRSADIDFEVLYDGRTFDQELNRRHGEVVRWDGATRNGDVIAGTTRIADDATTFGCEWVIDTEVRRTTASCSEGDAALPSLGGLDGMLNRITGANVISDGERTIAGILSFCFMSELSTAAGSLCVSADGIVTFADLTSRLDGDVHLTVVEIRGAPTEAAVRDAPILGAKGDFVSQRRDVPLDVSRFPPLPMITGLADD